MLRKVWRVVSRLDVVSSRIVDSEDTVAKFYTILTAPPTTSFLSYSISVCAVIVTYVFSMVWRRKRWGASP